MDIAKKKKASIRSGNKKAGPGYKSKIKMKKAKSDYYDFNLVAVIILIMCFGLVWCSEFIGIREMRKHVAWYTAGMPHSAGLRRRFRGR